MPFGSFITKEEAKKVAMELVGTVEVVNERIHRLVGTSVEGVWTEETKVVTRPVL